jgi:KaiC/GvpD/RAD55 family RecA-like ATPase
MNVLLLEDIKKIGAKRVVIDSLSVFAMQLKDAARIRKTIYKLIEMLKKTGATTLLLSETLEDSRNFSRFGIEEFVADGLISLNCVETDGIYSRFLAVRKMRRSQHTHELHPFEIGKNGLELLGAV